MAGDRLTKLLDALRRGNRWLAGIPPNGIPTPTPPSTQKPAPTLHVELSAKGELPIETKAPGGDGA